MENIIAINQSNKDEFKEEETKLKLLTELKEQKKVIDKSILTLEKELVDLMNRKSIKTLASVSQNIKITKTLGKEKVNYIKTVSQFEDKEKYFIKVSKKEINKEMVDGLPENQKVWSKIKDTLTYTLINKVK